MPKDRHRVISGVSDLFLRSLPEGYQEAINWGMLSNEVPRETYLNTSNKKSLHHTGLAAQKNYNSLYPMSVYQNPADCKELMTSFDAVGVNLIWAKL